MRLSCCRPHGLDDFAGEATETDGNTGTMQAAIATGYRAADEVLHHRRRQAA